MKVQSNALKNIYTFSDAPDAADYLSLAEYVENAKESDIHAALFPQRVQVANSLRHMAEAPDEAVHLSAYHTLRLFVF